MLGLRKQQLFMVNMSPAPQAFVLEMALVSLASSSPTRLGITLGMCGLAAGILRGLPKIRS